MSRKRQWLTLAEAIHKITGKPSRRFAISKRGHIERGYFADVVVFDPRTSTARLLTKTRPCPLLEFATCCTTARWFNPGPRRVLRPSVA